MGQIVVGEYERRLNGSWSEGVCSCTARRARKVRRWRYATH